MATKTTLSLVSRDQDTQRVAILDDLVVQGEALWDGFTGGRDGSLWYQGELAKAFREPAQTRGGPVGLLIRKCTARLRQMRT